MESLILKACHREDFSQDTQDVCSVFDELDQSRLVRMLPDLCANNTAICTVSDFTTFFKQKETEVRCLFSEVQRLLQLLLVVPASSATAELSFSCLRRLKNYLKATESQARLNHLAVLHTHQNKVYSIDIESIRDMFVQSKDNRRKVFGSCLHSSAD